MKILRLDLLAFGPFTDLSLSLADGGHGLHIIYGPNEAGKSSALRALRQLLYGIPERSSDSFIHSYQNLRIGGMLESTAGERLELIRRKGRNKTLRGPDDVELIDPLLLDEMLGGVDEVTFSQRFGIDYQELRRGGQAVVEGGGDLGEILFAAGAGVADLGLIQKRLDDEADQLFKARGSVQRINQALAELADARRAVKEAQLLTSEWTSHDQALRSAEMRQAEIDKQLRQKRAEKGRLERIHKALPLIGRRKRLEDQLAEVAGVPLLSDDFSGSRREAVTELAGAQQAERDASRAIEKLSADIAQLNLPQGLLEHRTAITQLHTDLGSYQKAVKDRPRLVARLEQVEQQARTILRDLGRAPQLEQADGLRLSRPQRQRIQSLAERCQAQLDKQSNADRTVQQLRSDIQRVESRLAGIPATRDVGELKRTMRRVQKHGDVDQQIADARAALWQLEQQADVDLKKLRLWTGTLEQLEGLPVPAPETIERFEGEMEVALSTLRRIEERIDEGNQRGQKLAQGLEKLRLEHDVPTEDDLTHARQRRDAGWRLIQQAWRDHVADDIATAEFVNEFAPGGDLARALEASVAAADAIADRLRREADRVAEKARLTADRQDLDRQLREQMKNLEEAHEAWDRLQSQWRDQWAGLNIDPLSPREMQLWLAQQRALAQMAQSIRTQRDRVNRSVALAQSLREELRQCLRQFGRSLPPEGDTLSQTLERCEGVVDEIESANQERQKYEEKLRTLRDELPEAERQAEQAQSDLEQWRTDWASAVAALGLNRDAAPSEANAVIESVNELFGRLEEAADIRRRVEGIDRDAQDFEQSVRRLLVLVAQDLSELPLDRAVADLYDRLQAVITAQTKLVAWKEQLAIEESKRDQARSKVQQLQATIQAMCRQAGCASADELPAAEQRSAQRREFERELRTVNEQLGDLAAGSPFDDWIAEAERFDPDQVRADLLRLDEEIAQLDREKTEAAVAMGSHRSALERMDGSDRAAAAQERAEHLLARIRSDAEQYIRVRLAAAVLRRAIDRYRQASQGPVLARASDLFAELTLGSFDGLRADYNEQGNAMLVGIRAGTGQPVGVEGMSDGTCDQLYLALRLALLESYLNDHEPLPFIVDDILIMFDDARAGAALKALARLSQKTQVVFFTHHEHLVRLAHQYLDDDVLFTHTLDRQAVTLPQANVAER